MKRLIIIPMLLILLQAVCMAQTTPISSVNIAVTQFAKSDSVFVSTKASSAVVLFVRYESGSDTLFISSGNDTTRTKLLAMLTPTSRTFKSDPVYLKFIRTWSSSGAIVRSLFVQ